MTNFNDTNKTLFPLEGTICRSCANRFSRHVVPLNFEEWDIDLEELDISEEDEVIVEQHVCLVLYQDLDCLVKSCNSYKPMNRQGEGLFMKDLF